MPSFWLVRFTGIVIGFLMPARTGGFDAQAFYTVTNQHIERRPAALLSPTAERDHSSAICNRHE